MVGLPIALPVREWGPVECCCSALVRVLMGEAEVRAHSDMGVVVDHNGGGEESPVRVFHDTRYRSANSLWVSGGEKKNP